MLMLFTWDTMTETPRSVLCIAWCCIATYIATSITGQPVRATTNTFLEVE